MKKILPFTLFSVLTLQVIAECDIQCYARYLYKTEQSNQGYYAGSEIGENPTYSGSSSNYTVWSNSYILNIKFCSGYEINEDLQTNQLPNNAIFAFVYWSNGGQSSILIENYSTKMKYINENEVKYDSNNNAIEKMTGYDTKGRYWEIYL